MNNLFQFLYNKKGKPIPFLFKLINNLPLTEDELTINGNLDLLSSNITSLPDNLTVNGHLYLEESNISELPNNLTVNGRLYISETSISELPDELYVGGDLFCRYTPLADNIKNDRSLLEKYQKQVKGFIYYDW